MRSVPVRSAESSRDPQHFDEPGVAEGSEGDASHAGLGEGAAGEDAEQACLREVGADEARGLAAVALERRGACGPQDAGFAQVGLIETGADNVDAVEARGVQVDTCEIGAAQVGSEQVRFGEVCLLELEPGEVEVGEVAARVIQGRVVGGLVEILGDLLGREVGTGGGSGGRAHCDH